jgi:transposase-like protein
MWSAVDVDSRELLALEASYGRSSLNALSFLKEALRICTNKPLVLVDRAHSINVRWKDLVWSIGVKDSVLGIG